ncbi:MAG: hypothetical protein CMI02_10040 [Oceanospirillaceae bacterium]|uniref:polysaccharide deacetylase family protein n=1 Tax=Marinobacter nauticus TaxID=2743 RepID=UPI000C39DDCC|nr:hypothetical protein [Oceanospirillaceae bacterium]MBT12362.1 hypothetical protein [Oceanospirillaceae bacterium]|tara:strand:- start:55386 stop:56426 length:1041 start_codon:yes stop_codon:yes gene_type:complete
MIKNLITLLFFLGTAQVNAQLVILQYHHVDASTPPATSISPDDFASHLQLLEDEGMQIVDLATAMQKIQAGESLPDKAVAITFDDAYRSVYDTAWPMLKERQWPFTVFVNPAFVDQQYNSIMSWDELKTLQDAGNVIANHSMHHKYLIERPADIPLNDWMNQEVEAAETRLEEKLGTSHRLLAYPYGEFNLAMTAWLKDHNYLAFGQHSGPVGKVSHMQAIPRFPAAGVYANTKTLRTKLYTMPFAVGPQQLQEPVLPDASLPALSLTIPLQDFYASQLQCFASSEGKIATEKETQADGGLKVRTQASEPMPGGRSRYNCTAPSKAHKGWYYWYSQLWINKSVANR